MQLSACTSGTQGVPGAAGALQLGWSWLTYCYRRVNRRSTWGVVLVASLLGGGLGFAGFGALALLAMLH